MLRLLHAIGMHMINLGVEIQIAVAKTLGVPNPHLAVRQILIDQLLRRFKEEAGELGLPEEEVMPLPEPRVMDISGLH